MTKRYRTEPYLTRAEATVVRVEGQDVWLDDPIIFAFSGGQQADRGRIDGHEVLESEAEADGAIRYRLPEGHGLEPGQAVIQEIDGDLRRRIMRVHTATHMAFAAVSELMGGPEPLIGSNVHAGKGRLDWEREGSVSPFVADATARVAELVARDLPVARFPEEEGSDRWMWQIEGEDLDPELWRMPCGGTHVARTSEVGAVRLKRKNIGKGKERIEVTLLD